MRQITQMPVLQAFLNPLRYVLFQKKVVAIYCASERVADSSTFFHIISEMLEPHFV